MKVLIACEYSGVVRDAFAAKGHEAWSCDILPTERLGLHILGDVLEVLDNGWDLMIAHPPCTYLSYAGNKYFNTPGRAKKRLEALEFFLALWNAPIEKICIENPLGIVSKVIKNYSQIINPYFFGEPELKRTCLWLKNLPDLVYTMTDNLFEMRTSVDKPEPVYVDKSGKKRYFTDAIGGYHGEGSSFKKRSVTFKSIAEAMADQWSN